MEADFKVVIQGPPVVDENLVQILFGTDVKGLAAQISSGKWDHVINSSKEGSDDGELPSAVQD